MGGHSHIHDRVNSRNPHLTVPKGLQKADDLVWDTGVRRVIHRHPILRKGIIGYPARGQILGHDYPLGRHVYPVREEVLTTSGCLIGKSMDNPED
ncbi:MAG: hypothetical protein LAT68_16170 [Cyclobacteriaceae bacterium]|nr:hypothetical protein [Cyclobacteriaceae bacterium]